MREKTDARKLLKRGKQKRNTRRIQNAAMGNGRGPREISGRLEEETEGSRLRKTVRYLKALDRAENKKKLDKAQEVRRGKRGGGVDDRRRTTTSR